MNIQEMHALCEHLLRKGVHPHTPLVITESEDATNFDEISSVDLIEGPVRRDPSPKMHNPLPEKAIALYLCTDATLLNTIPCEVLTSVGNLDGYLGRDNQIFPPKELELNPPVFNGLPPVVKPITREWFIDYVKSQCDSLVVTGGRNYIRHSKPQYESWVKACISGELPPDYLTSETSGFFQSIGAHGGIIGPRYLLINTERFSYVVNCTTLEIKVSTMGSPWQVWGAEDVVADLQSDIERVFEEYI